MKSVSNTLVKPTAPKTFSAQVNSPNIRAMIDKSVGNSAKAASFVSTLISVVNTTPKLQQCDTGTIISAALRGEIGMGLSVALGEYAIIPYGDKAQFQLQTNGIKRLAIRSKAYSAIGFEDVREGEYKGRDAKTREPIFDWIEDEDEREKKPIVGYYAFYRLNEENNGFFNSVYWSHDKILRHADRYSKAFDYAKYQKMLKGELKDDEVARLKSGSPWYAEPNEEAHIKMCKKTVAKQLLSDGLAPKELMQAIAEDNSVERTGESVIHDPSDLATITDDEIVVAEATGEIIDADVADRKSTEEKKPVKSANDTAAKKTTRRAKPTAADDDFFD